MADFNDKESQKPIDLEIKEKQTPEANTDANYQPYDSSFKKLFAQKHNVAHLGILKQSKSNASLEAKPLSTEFSLDKPYKAFLDTLYVLTPDPKAKKFPKGFNSKKINLLAVEYEEEWKAENITKHIIYMSLVIKEYYQSLKDQVNLLFYVIYGPEVKARKDLKVDFGAFKYAPNIIFLSETKKHKLFSEINSLIKTNQTPTCLQLLQLAHLSRNKDSDINEIKECLALGLKALQGDKKLSEDFFSIFMKVCSSLIDKDQERRLLEEPPMRSLYEEIIQEHEQQARQETEKKVWQEAEKKVEKARQEIEKKVWQEAEKKVEMARQETEKKARQEAEQDVLASVAENLLKDGIPRKNIIKSLRVSTEWLTNLEKSISKKDSPHGPRM